MEPTDPREDTAQEGARLAASYGERVPTGIAGLDRVLHGGLLRGSAYIIQGAPGLGKTVLANQVAFHHARAGARTLYTTLLSESHAQMFVHLRSLGFFDAALIPDSVCYCSGYAALDEGGLAGLLAQSVQELRRRRASLLVLDGLFVAHALANTENEFRRFVHELQGQLAMVGATALLLTNQRRDPSSAEFTMVDGWIELTEHLVGPWNVRSVQVRKMRGSAFLGGQHKLRITQAGMEVYPRLESTVRARPECLPDPGERVSVGLAGLDEMLRGGLPAGTSTLLYGSSGGGKTTLGLHFLGLASAAGPGLFAGFYEGPRTLARRAAALGIDLDQLTAAGVLDVLWSSPTEMLSDEVAIDILDAVRARGVRRLFVDGIGALRGGFVHPQRFHGFMNALANELRALGVTTLLTQETSPLFPVGHAAVDDVSGLMDNLLVLQHQQAGRTFERHLSVVKLRGSSFDPVARRFEITDRGIDLGPGADGGAPPPLATAQGG